MVKEIPLTQGKVALVDDEDYEMLVGMGSWQYHNGYAARKSKRPARRTTYMHRIILEPGEGQSVDHINGDRLDNRSCNLRKCTQAENMRNQRLSAANTSGYKGVALYKPNGKWRAILETEKRFISLGYYSCKHDAARSYNRGALEQFGEFASLNIVPNPEVTCNCESCGVTQNVQVQ